MALPTYDPLKHDVSLDGYGFMLATGDANAPASMMAADSEPATSRAAIGDGGSENFTLSSYFFQTDTEGGVGQVRLASADRVMTAIAETRFQGHIFPPKKVLTTGSVGTGSLGYMRIGSTLYGVHDTAVEAVGAGTSYAGSDLTPAVGQRIKATPYNTGMWVNDANEIKRFNLSAVSDITANLPDGFTAGLVDLYNRWIWALGSQTYVATSDVRQSATATNSATSGSSSLRTRATLTNDPVVGNYLVAFFLTDTGGGVPEDPEGWDVLYNGTVITAWGKPVEGPDDRILQVAHTAGGIVFEVLWLIEVTGIDLDAPVLEVTPNTTANGTSHATGSVDAQTGFIIAAWQKSTVTADFQATTDYTSLGADSITIASAWEYALRYRGDTTDTSATITTSSSPGAGTANLLVKLRSNSITADLEQTTFLVSDDGGETWDPIPNKAGGMPAPISSLAAQGSLWITTAYGLYEVRQEEVETQDTTSILVAVRGPLDEFQYPLDADSIGTHLASFDGSLYYNLGATLRRFPPGGRAEQIWPPRGWSIGGGSIISLTSGEGGIYFGTSDGYLWNYDGRGFHQIAAATPEQLSVLHWHAGKLYLAGDPAPYFEYGYPSLRPDVYDAGPDTYDVGYVITSIINFEKVGDLKIARRFETQAEFSAGATAAESGALTLQYCILDAGFHPDIFAPDDETADWITVGTHSVADGNVKNYTLGTPIEFKRILLRVILTPGTVGIPICEGFGIDGEAMMLFRERFPMNLSISTDTRHRATNAGGDNLMYPTEAAVAEAIDQLMRWRSPEHASHDPVVTVVYRETGGTTSTHTCILEKIDRSLESHQGANGQFSHAQVTCVFREIP